MVVFDFYSTINKPFLSPPPIVFGIVWPILYLLMAVSFILVILSDNSPTKISAIILFILQLIINLSWTKIFFTDKNFEIAFWTCLILTLLVITMTIAFFKQSLWAGILQIPYCLWLTFACYLSYQIKLSN